MKSLIRGKRIGRNSADNSKISGTLADRIANPLIYGKKRKSDTDLRIAIIKKALNDFANQVRTGNQRKGNNIKKASNSRKLKKLKFVKITIIYHGVK